MDRFRKNYTPINDTQKEFVKQIKSKAEELELLYEEVDHKVLSRIARESEYKQAKLDMQTALLNLKQSVMWMVNAATYDIE